MHLTIPNTASHVFRTWPLSQKNEFWSCVLFPIFDDAFRGWFLPLLSAFNMNVKILTFSPVQWFRILALAGFQCWHFLFYFWWCFCVTLQTSMEPGQVMKTREMYFSNKCHQGVSLIIVCCALDTLEKLRCYLCCLDNHICLPWTLFSSSVVALVLSFFSLFSVILTSRLFRWLFDLAVSVPFFDRNQCAVCDDVHNLWHIHVSQKDSVFWYM